MNHSKAAIIVSSIIEKVQLAVAICFLGFFGLASILMIGDAQLRANGGIAMGLIGDLIGLGFLYCSIKRGKLRKNFKKYVAALSQNPSGSIEALAASVGEPADRVSKNLEKMIHKKFFSNAFIDIVSNRLVMPNRTPMAQPGNPVMQNQNPAGAPMNRGAAPVQQGRAEMVTVTCKGCGAVNIIPRGQVGECEYCGSGIKG